MRLEWELAAAVEERDRTSKRAAEKEVSLKAEIAVSSFASSLVEAVS